MFSKLTLLLKGLCGKKKSALIILMSLISTGLYAEGKVTFIMGEVYIITKGKKVLAGHGMKVPDNAEIVTSKDGLISIYNYKSKDVLTVNPGSKVQLNNSIASVSSRSKWNKVFKNSKMSTNYTSVAAIRGNEEGRVDVNWADDDDMKNKINRSKEWRLYRKGDYVTLLKKTKSSSDAEGMYLEAMANYMVFGVQKEDLIINRFKRVEKLSTDKNLKSESRKMMALINFELGKYSESLMHLKRYIRTRKDKDIDELSYYMLVVNNKYLGNNKEQKQYARKMELYHRGSTLLSSIQ